MNKILFRASCIGKIMTNSRSKSELLSETCKKYLSEIFIQEKYGRKKEIVNKYVTKGLECEENSIALYSTYKKDIFFKNEQFYKNEFVCGTPDIVDGFKIIDIKSSWSIFTFLDAKDSLNKDYYYQIQTYLALTGKEKGTLAYCLTNTPDCLIQDEKKRLMWKMNVYNDMDKNYLEACAEIDKLCLYDDIPLEERVHEIEIERDEKAIQSIYDRVEECREYMNTNLFKLQTA
jgi:hypothetical protein